MTTNTSSRAESKKRSIVKKKGSGFIDAMVAATIEVGQAAESFRASIGHMGEARKKGRVVTKRIARTATKTRDAVVKTVRRVTRKKSSRSRA